MNTKEDTLRLRKATDADNRYAVAYLRWLAGAKKNKPLATRPQYGLTPERGQELREEVRRLVHGARERGAA